MTPDPLSPMERREFLKLAGAVSAVSLTRGALAETKTRLRNRHRCPGSRGRLCNRCDGRRSNCAKRSQKRARQCEIVQSLRQAKGAGFQVLVAGAGSELAKGFPQAGGGLSGPESLRLAPGKKAGVPAVLVSGSDERGFVYGLLELAERVRFSSDTNAALHLNRTVEEKPANEVRSVGRYFCSEVEDKAWYYDKDFWRGYLDLLAASRFNRFCLGLGLEYDFPKGRDSDYLHFPYPYLVNVPGYNGVRVMQLADSGWEGA